MTQSERLSKVVEVLEHVEDPEIPVSIVDLGIVAGLQVDDDGTVAVTLIPTRFSCPARRIIESSVVSALQSAFPGSTVTCIWKQDEQWTPRLITNRGRRVLSEFGVSIPSTTADGKEQYRCPYCSSEAVEETSPFGVAVCRSIYKCLSCRCSFETFRWLGPL